MIQNSSMLIDLNISVWTGRKMDKKVSDEIGAAKNAKGRVGNYHKALLGANSKLEEIQSLVGAIRTWHYAQTLPWSDAGSRLLPMANFFDYKATLTDYETRFSDAVKQFLAEYPTLVTAAAFQLGDLFDSNEYPDVSKLVDKFNFKYVFLPVPEFGDFRVDINETYKQELINQYQGYFDVKLKEAMNDVWDRLHDCLSKMSEKLTDLPSPRVLKDGSEVYTAVFRDSLVTNAEELCGLLTKLNVANDPKLEQARKKLESTMFGVTAKDLRKDNALRQDVKDKVDEILGMF